MLDPVEADFTISTAHNLPKINLIAKRIPEIHPVGKTPTEAN